jgi:hypothetical protein
MSVVFERARLPPVAATVALVFQPTQSVVSAEGSGHVLVEPLEGEFDARFSRQPRFLPTGRLMGHMITRQEPSSERSRQPQRVTTTVISAVTVVEARSY